MFRRALDHFGCKPEECLFVGDNLKWDTVGARLIPVLIGGHVDVNSATGYPILVFDLQI